MALLNFNFDDNQFTKAEAVSIVNTINDFTPGITTLADAPTIQWPLAGNTIAEISLSLTIGTSRGIDITGTVRGHIGTLIVTHTSANTVITLPGNSDGLVWNNTNAGGITILTYIYTGATYLWSSNHSSNSGAAGPSIVSLAMVSSTNITVAGLRYVPTTPNGTSWGNSILWQKKIAAGTDGYIQSLIADGSDLFGMIGLSKTFTEKDYPTLNAALWCGSSDPIHNPIVYSYIDGVGAAPVDTSVQAFNGDIQRIVVSGRQGTPVYKFQVIRQDGTPVDIATITSISDNVDLFLHSVLRGDGAINTPQGYGII